jgi:hypothetical protein
MRLAIVMILLAAPVAAEEPPPQLASEARFLHPAAPAVIVLDGGATLSYLGYLPETADAYYHIAWDDGDFDPYASFTFYYLDHLVSDAVNAEEILTIGAPVVDILGRPAANIAATCSCDSDGGFICPDLGARWCENFIDWDTHAIADGSYWVVAVNDEPPFFVYNASLAPVRIAHGARLPPAVLVELPDGLGHTDTSYRIEAIAIGTGTMKLDLAWGDASDPATVLQPVHPIASGLPVVIGSDGMTGYDWDVSGLDDGAYFVRATLTDDNGTAFSDSRYPLDVFHDHPADLAFSPARDFAIPISDGGMNASGCSCAIARRRPAPPMAFIAVALAIGCAIGRSRRGRRARGRSRRNRGRGSRPR